MQKKFKVDEIILVLIVALIALAVSVLDKANKPEMEAKKIKDMLLDDHEISMAAKGVIEESRLSQIRDMGYDDLKNSLGAENDFCIYIEDENGNIILAKGSSKLGMDGMACR
ncbi:hypothetical protein HYX08_01420 [Candidatus Woesearchaeota archaeon]|nr:hypothetical protein [Candidatus Woesearchaeota archaeon]